MAFALTDESLSLERACIRFQTSIRKVQAEEHGKITPQYIDYNRNDVRATFELAKAMKAEYATYHLDLPPTKSFSPPPTLGKVYLNQMGVESFFFRNPQFPRDILGYAMECFYGGQSAYESARPRSGWWSSTSLACTPPCASSRTSGNMSSPSRSRTHDDTDAVRQLVNNPSLDTFKNQAAWRDLERHLSHQTDEDILPVRCHYRA